MLNFTNTLFDLSKGIASPLLYGCTFLGVLLFLFTLCSKVTSRYVFSPFLPFPPLFYFLFSCCAPLCCCACRHSTQQHKAMASDTYCPDNENIEPQREYHHQENGPAWQRGACISRKPAAIASTNAVFSSYGAPELTHDPRWGVVEDKELNKLLQGTF